MWLGPGGWLALLVLGWGVVWARRLPETRPWTAWAGTAVAIPGLAMSLAVASAASLELAGYARIAAAPTVEARIAERAALVGVTGVLVWVFLGCLAFGGLVIATRRGGRSALPAGSPLWPLVALVATWGPAVIGTVLLLLGGRATALPADQLDAVALITGSRTLVTAIVFGWAGIGGGLLWGFGRVLLRLTGDGG